MSGESLVVMTLRARSGLRDRKSTRLNSSHSQISYAVFCLKKKSQGVSVRHHGNGVEAALTFADGFEDGNALGGDGEAVSRVLNVATGDDSSRSRPKRSAQA